MLGSRDIQSYIDLWEGASSISAYSPQTPSVPGSPTLSGRIAEGPPSPRYSDSEIEGAKQHHHITIINQTMEGTSRDYAASFISIAQSNPFGDSDSLPFTPDELWNFHRPPPPPPKANGRSENGRSEISHPSPRTGFEYDDYERLEPTSPQRPYSPPESPIEDFEPLLSPATHKSKSSSVSSIDGQPISSKAAKMLGIDPACTVIRDRSAFVVMDVPDSYNSHRARSYPPLQLRNSTPSSPPVSSPLNAPSLVSSKPHYDATLDATRIWKFLKRSKKPDTEILSSTLVRLSHSPHKLSLLSQKYRELYGDDLMGDIHTETTGYYRMALVRLISGVHESEALALLHSTLDDKIIAETLFGKSPDELRAVLLHYEQMNGGIPLEAALVGAYPPADASVAAFRRACVRALKADREVESVELLAMMDSDRLMERERRLIYDVGQLYGTNRQLNQKKLLELVLQRSDLYLRELSRRFYERHGCELSELVAARDRSSVGHAVAFALTGAINKPRRDAGLLEDCMKGLGVNDARLIARVIRIHNDPDPRHLLFVKKVYQQRYGRALGERVRKDTRGPYRDLLLKILEGRSESFF